MISRKNRATSMWKDLTLALFSFDSGYFVLHTPILELFVMEGKGFLWTQLLDLILPPSPKTQYTISAAGSSTRREKICRCAYHYL